MLVFLFRTATDVPVFIVELYEIKVGISLETSDVIGRISFCDTVEDVENDSVVVAGTDDRAGVTGVANVAVAVGLDNVVGLAGTADVVDIIGVVDIAGLAGADGVVGVAGTANVVDIIGVVDVDGTSDVAGVVGVAGTVGESGVDNTADGDETTCFLSFLAKLDCRDNLSDSKADTISSTLILALLFALPA